jgi:hypothetical protein
MISYLLIMNLLLLTLPLITANYYLGGTAGGLNSQRMIVVNRPREPYGRRNSRNYYNCDECNCSADADDSDDVGGCAYCKPRNFRPIIDPTNPTEPGGPGGPGGPGDQGPGEGDCCLQNSIDIDDLNDRLIIF